MKNLRRPMFNLLLRAFPAAFRRRFGEAMREAFEAACHEHESGSARRLGFLLRTSFDMVWTGFHERLRPTTASRPTVRQAEEWGGVRFSYLDVKLGLRMLVKHPGLTMVTVFALAIGIPAGLSPTYLANAFEAPLPVPDGDRIRLVRNWNQVTARPDVTTSYDFQQWRTELTTFETLGAARMSLYNVRSEDGLTPPIQGAAITASTFDILRVPPLLGRTLGAADEKPGAPSVAVIGFDMWQSRLGGDPRIVGRDLWIGGVVHTVVGVMPKEFLFPMDHQLWLPLKDLPTSEPGDGLPLIVFGRLPEQRSEESAQAQLTTLGRRTALAFPETHSDLLPQVTPFSYLVASGLPKGGIGATVEFYLAQILALGLLMVACTNVGMLIFARISARSAELSVRTALGASRSRIVTQVFTESMVLALVAAGLGLLLLHWLPSRLISMSLTRSLPYWIDLSVRPETVLWTLVLAVLSAAVAGIIPAVRATGKSVHRNIQRTQANRSGVRFAGMSSALIVADVAIAVATVGVAAGMSYQLSKSWNDRDATGIEAARFLSTELRFPGLDQASSNGTSDLDVAARSAERQRALATLVARLEAEPGVRGVAVASVLPRMEHPSRRVEVEGLVHADGTRAARVRTARVDQNFFGALGQPILRGRGFDTHDFRKDASAVIVNTTFVAQVLDGRNPIGRRIRYTTKSGDGEPGPWYEIAGVVGRLGMRVVNPEGDQGIYHPLPPGSDPVHLAIHLGDDPEAFIPRFRALANDVDPTLSIGSPVALNKVRESDWYLMAAMTLGGGALVGLLLALAASGIYAIMSFAVAERTREIGIRTALGARRSDIVFTVAKRALSQVGMGALLGTPVAGRIFFEFQQDAGLNYSGVLLLLGALTPGVVVMMLVGVVACTAPTLRALRVSPTEALKI